MFNSKESSKYGAELNVSRVYVLRRKFGRCGRFHKLFASISRDFNCWGFSAILGLCTRSVVGRFCLRVMLKYKDRVIL